MNAKLAIQSFLGNPQLQSHDTLKERRMNKPPRTTGVRPPLHPLVLPRLPERIRRLLNAPYATLWGAGHMTLDEWRDLEQQLKHRLEK